MMCRRKKIHRIPHGALREASGKEQALYQPGVSDKSSVCNRLQGAEPTDCQVFSRRLLASFTRVGKCIALRWLRT
jgi:hypothetical protein